MSNIFSGLVRIGSDPEVRHIPSGKSVLNFSAASSTGYGDKKQTLWLRVTYWNNAERMAEMLSKGSQIVVSGELSQREYESNGKAGTSLELNANVIDLISNGNGGGQQSALRQSAPQQNKQDDFEDDGIPF